MSKEPKKVKVEKLELSNETIADLIEEEAEKVEGGKGLLVTLDPRGSCVPNPGVTKYVTCAYP